jgi:hypothetical protein
MATLSISGYTPPYPRNDSAEHNPTTLEPPFPCNSHLSASTQVQPQDHPSNTAASLGWVRSHTSATSRAALHAPASPLSSVMMTHCSGKAATGVAVGGVRTGCGGRRLVWVVLLKVSIGRVLLWETDGGRGWYRQSDPSPQMIKLKVALSYSSTHTFRAPPLVARAGTRAPSSTMPLSTPPSARAGSAAARVLALCELWFIIAAHSGVVGAWRLAGVCRAARQAETAGYRGVWRLWRWGSVHERGVAAGSGAASVGASA